MDIRLHPRAQLDALPVRVSLLRPADQHRCRQDRVDRDGPPAQRDAMIPRHEAARHLCARAQGGERVGDRGRVRVLPAQGGVGVCLDGIFLSRDVDLLLGAGSGSGYLDRDRFELLLLLLIKVTAGCGGGKKESGCAGGEERGAHFWQGRRTGEEEEELGTEHCFFVFKVKDQG